MGGISEDFMPRATENVDPTTTAILALYAATTSALSALEVAEMMRLPLSRVQHHLGVLVAIKELRCVRAERRDGTELFSAY